MVNIIEHTTFNSNSWSDKRRLKCWVSHRSVDTSLGLATSQRYTDKYNNKRMTITS